MITFSLQSGSNGNSIYVEAGNQRLLFDAGISARRAAERLAGHGRSPQGLTALLISHDHHDHVCGVGPFHRIFQVPVYATRPTAQTAAHAFRRVRDLRHFRAGDTLLLGDVRVHTRRTPHDAADGVCFVVEHAGKRLGIFTDVGCAYGGLVEALATCDAAYLESNYDPDMLARGPYSRELQDRIRGFGGHLSNFEAAGLVRERGGRMDWVALAHLSAQNNHPDVALATHRRMLGDDYPLQIAGRDGASPLLHV